jgi:60 kDa SS-A/Ro ribonucleoprotein
MQTYRGLGPRNAVTAQSEPIPGSNQVPNSAGGYAWEVDHWEQLRRFLILGSEKGTYYIGERELTKQNASAVQKCLEEDGIRTINTIVEISEAGRAPKNEPALLALAMASASKDVATRQYAFTVLPRVARIGTHLLHFVSYMEQFRGWGRSAKNGIQNWFNEKSAQDVAFQVTKYPSRDKWSMRDLLRLSKPKPSSAQHGKIYRAVAGKEVDWNQEPTPADQYMDSVCQVATLAGEPKKAAQVIRDHRLPREVLPTELLNSKEVWEALLEDMPMTAMIRNLATMTRVGLIAPMSDGTKQVVDKLSDITRLRRSRVHPLQVLSALLTYQLGHGIRGSNTWTPIPQVIDALDGAFYESFQNVTPSGKRIMLGLDISGSMQGQTIAGIPGMSAIKAESVMAMVTARVEPQYYTVAFHTTAQAIDISPRQRLDDIVQTVDSMPKGGTDCAQPILAALRHAIPVDTFVIYTDSETWQGTIHPKQAIDQYRQKMGIPSKLIVVAMTANRFSIADPNDAGMLFTIGFDTTVPQVIAEFS